MPNVANVAETRPNEMEITPEMIEAGLRVLWRCDLSCPDRDELKLALGEIFLEMLRSRKELA